MNKLYTLALSLVLGFGIFSLFSGLLLGIIFILLWIDKIILGILGLPGKFGIEFVTISTVLLGMEYGPINGFVFALIVIPLVEGAKYNITGLPSEWPPFVPSPDHVIDGTVAVIAWLLLGFELLIVVIICLIAKYAMQYAKSFLMEKPPDILYMVFTFVFNVFLVIYAGEFFISFLS